MFRLRPGQLPQERAVGRTENRIGHVQQIDAEMQALQDVAQRVAQTYAARHARLGIAQAAQPFALPPQINSLSRPAGNQAELVHQYGGIARLQRDQWPGGGQDMFENLGSRVRVGMHDS
ncbi:hypothetical protein EC912_101510 [Luteibacter rhizovicinus]|uniref:Uncharacterized protein n=1 Tax=Luteibacter rhizovicinus TaxID=242606 RepID=A0A4R3YWE9_9GAMM|nr:hypothetical protein EC912_101510 [Luteibacter rhizovicinus]